MTRLTRRARIAVATALGVSILVVLVFALPVPRSVVNAVFDPSPTAALVALATQREAAEHGIERGYRKAIEQLDATRKLKVSLAPAQVDAIAAKATKDLRDLRRNALVALGEAVGIRGDAGARYTADAEVRLDALPDLGSEPGILVAPRLLTIIQRMDELAAQLADEATRQLTAPQPAATSTPRVTGSPSPRPASSPSR